MGMGIHRIYKRFPGTPGETSRKSGETASRLSAATLHRREGERCRSEMIRKSWSGVGKINSVLQNACTGRWHQTICLREHQTITPPRTPHFNVVHPPVWPRQQTLFFCRRTSSPDKLQNNIERGGKGGRCGLYRELLVGRSQARFMTEHCLFFQHRERFESFHLILHANLGRPRTLDAQCRLCGFDECKVGEATEVAVQKMSGLGSPPRTDPGYPVLARMR